MKIITAEELKEINRKTTEQKEQAERQKVEAEVLPELDSLIRTKNAEGHTYTTFAPAKYDLTGYGKKIVLETLRSAGYKVDHTGFKGEYFITWER